MSIAYRSAALFCVLAVLAYGAPAYDYDDYALYEDVDTFIPELVETRTTAGMSVENLEEQFSELQNQLMSGAMVTPQVKKTIDKMIALVTTEIEPAIKDAHASDQALIHASVGEITNLNEETTVNTAALQARAKSTRAVIEKHNGLAKELNAAAAVHQGSITAYETTVTKKTRTCCLYREAQQPDLEYTPTSATCDYESSDADACVKAAATAAAMAVKDKFENAAQSHKMLKTSCAELTTQVTKDQSTMVKNDMACDGKAAEVHVEASIVKTNLPQLMADWNSAEANYKKKFAELTGNYSKTSGEVRKREQDRQNEWDATQEIKCMLVHYQEGGTFDEKAQAACKTKIDHSHLVIIYPVVGPAFQWVLGEFPKLIDTAADQKICTHAETADEQADTNHKCVLTPPKTAPTCTVEAAVTEPPTSQPTEAVTAAMTEEKEEDEGHPGNLKEEEMDEEEPYESNYEAVSYTHLTLPTKRIV
eukprot:TRINITY_DN7362_c0_g1_i7.p1 TRINITY_DN7362_c0_g1~~TRINITY_DN7362_c0_g1_i7.p1  ORF type:complete len:478 (-),score=142.17 TRINITY_DN7362_c0_g1_i7:132-1565(-)